MTTDFVQLLKDQSALAKQLAATQPEMLQGFMAMKSGVIKDGALPAKTKELIALVLGVQSQCEPCIAYHTNECIKMGVSRQEVAEAVGVTVVMGGGPKLQYAGKALAAYDQFTAAQ